MIPIPNGEWTQLDYETQVKLMKDNVSGEEVKLNTRC